MMKNTTKPEDVQYNKETDLDWIAWIRREIEKVVPHHIRDRDNRINALITDAVQKLCEYGRQGYNYNSEVKSEDQKAFLEAQFRGISFRFKPIPPVSEAHANLNSLAESRLQVGLIDKGINADVIQSHIRAAYSGYRLEVINYKRARCILSKEAFEEQLAIEADPSRLEALSTGDRWPSYQKYLSQVEAKKLTIYGVTVEYQSEDSLLDLTEYFKCRLSDERAKSYPLPKSKKNALISVIHINESEKTATFTVHDDDQKLLGKYLCCVREVKTPNHVYNAVAALAENRLDPQPKPELHDVISEIFGFNR